MKAASVQIDVLNVPIMRTIIGAATDFVTAYDAASVSDEEGLLQAVDPDAMRQLWHRVDEAATDLRQALIEASNSQASPE